jgi:pyridoxine 5'-phosphate synthase PdxJ
MTRITVNLEALANLYQNEPDMVRAITKNALACEIAGADSILMGMGKEYDQKRKKLVSTLVDNLDISLSVRSELVDRSLEALIDLKPSMVILPFQSDRKDSLASAITSLQVENILVGLQIPLELEQIKDAAKLKCDYVILDCDSFCNAKTLTSRLDELNKIVKLVGLSGRLSMGAVASGDFTANQLSKIGSAVQIEEYILGLPFFSNSLIYGYARAIEMAKYSLS